MLSVTVKRVSIGGGGGVGMIGEVLKKKTFQKGIMSSRVSS